MGIRKIWKPKKPLEQFLKDWQRRLHQEQSKIDRHIQDAEKEEIKVEKSIKDASMKNDILSARAFAMEMVKSRKTVRRLLENKADLNSIILHLGEYVAIVRAVGQLSKSAKVTKLVNNLMKGPEVSSTLKEFKKEMTKAGVIDEIIIDPVNKALDLKCVVEETEEVDKVLAEIARTTAGRYLESVKNSRTPYAGKTTSIRRVTSLR